MATIVYEGAAGHGGTLFEGLTFFFLQRVPSRTQFVETVQSNGGQVVKLEKNADIVIADHARKDCPVGSISWTFIDRSVSSGKLEEKENHPAGPTTRTIREVGSRQSAKSIRTPYTTQDDRDLLIWITKAQRRGLPLAGNNIYIQLEQINPRHTYQSWRDRWVKKLSHQPQTTFSKEELSTEPFPNASKYQGARKLLSRSPESDSAVSNEQEASMRLPSSPMAQPISTQRRRAREENQPKSSREAVAPQTQAMVPLVRTSLGGMNFTEEETDLMIDSYEVMAEVAAAKGVDAWAKFAVGNPNHNAKEWHQYFTQIIEPMMKKKNQSSTISSSSKGDAPQPAGELSLSKSSKARLSKEIEIPDSMPVEAQPLRTRFPDPSTKDEKMFIEDLTAFARSSELDVDSWPIICGRKIPLFRLWQVVNMDKFGGYDEVQGLNKWHRVARELNFEDFRHATAPSEVKNAYEQILPDFEEERVDFIAQLQEQDLIASQLQQTAEYDTAEEDYEEDLAEGQVEMEEEADEEDEFDDDLEAPLSVPRNTFSNKRNPDMSQRMHFNGSPILGSFPKRQRVDKGKGKERELPSTPEDILELTSKPRSRHKVSPPKYMHAYVEDDDEEVFSGSVSKPKLQAHQRIQRTQRAMEPETQDFNFLPVDDDEAASSSIFLKNRQKADPAVKSGLKGYHEDSSTQSQTDSQKEQELQDYIEHHQSLGYELEVILTAITSTSMMTGDAAEVMEELSQGRGIPDNIQGVWTETDDAALHDIESKEFERIIVKHGTKCVVQRQKFVALQQMAMQASRQPARR